MSKGLEYIRDISCLISENYSDKEPLTEEQKLSKNCFLDYCKCIEKELKRLEELDNAKPSKALELVDEIEALECLEEIEDIVMEFNGANGVLTRKVRCRLKTIEQALIQSGKTKKELAFEIIKKKRVSLGVLRVSKNLEYYNDDVVFNCNCLTKEEFNLLKEVLEDD